MSDFNSPRPDGSAADETRLSDGSAQRSPSLTLSSSSGIDHGRFPPGTILGGRYRMVGRLGRGGMGEVFRADDLKLGQQVALKFLPPEVDRDPARLSQLHSEVRMARQVSHPNVCRVYDIDEVEGHTFLSMEYVDGEDLASLLRRIGRFPEERGLEIARQICAGLAAAHERGVVHRDFKPANVMLDGTGRVRITDFGLAGAAGESLRAGTPAYMAPEQLSGAEVTVRSDIYALGLVLYEIFTGRRALEGNSLAEIIRRREQGDILPPSAVTNVSPEIDRAIMRCLAVDPKARPSSAFSVSAALPGGDPLAAALAAGETPSPEMVAAAGEHGGLSRAAGVSLLGFVIAALLVIGLIAERRLLVNRADFSKSADVLAERAREIITRSGAAEPVADWARGVGVNREYLDWVARTDASPTRWDAVGDRTAPLLDFWYRTSPMPLRPWQISWSPGMNDPPPDFSGMVTVVVDDQGRLLELLRVPPQQDRQGDGAPPVDWTPMFEAAGLSIAAFRSATPEWNPRVYADRRAAWEGPMANRPGVTLRVEAASYAGRPVSFKVVGPWTTAARMVLPAPSRAQQVLSAMGSFVILSLIAGAVLLVRANLQSGRADRRGAGRIALALLAVWLAAWMLGARHTVSLPDESTSFFVAAAIALLSVGATWLFYLALEPFVRRLLPDMLIGWTRLLVGHIRDPHVGRDILVGVATGVLFVLTGSAGAIAPSLWGDAPPQLHTSNMAYFVGARYAISNILIVLPNAIQGAMIGAFLYVVLLSIVRRHWIAGGLVLLFVCGVILAEAGEDFVWMTAAFAGIAGVTTVVVFLRFGLLALATALSVNQILQVVPLTLDFTQPHGVASALALLAVGGLAVWSFYTSRAGEGLFRRILSPA